MIEKLEVSDILDQPLRNKINEIIDAMVDIEKKIEMLEEIIK